MSEFPYLFAPTKGYIYKLVNTLTKEFYIGQTANMRSRVSCHYKINRKCKSKKLFKNGAKVECWILERPLIKNLLEREKIEIVKNRDNPLYIGDTRVNTKEETEKRYIERRKRERKKIPCPLCGAKIQTSGMSKHQSKSKCKKNQDKIKTARDSMFKSIQCEKCGMRLSGRKGSLLNHQNSEVCKNGGIQSCNIKIKCNKCGKMVQQRNLSYHKESRACTTNSVDQGAIKQCPYCDCEIHYKNITTHMKSKKCNIMRLWSQEKRDIWHNSPKNKRKCPWAHRRLKGVVKTQTEEERIEKRRALGRRYYHNNIKHLTNHQ
tara:strand:+ start:4013 stop:4969 length:957 start_codon:yes stop_codon:yes gene_type:complete